MYLALVNSQMDSGDLFPEIYKVLSHSFYGCVILQAVGSLFKQFPLVGYVGCFWCFAMINNTAHLLSFHMHNCISGTHS